MIDDSGVGVSGVGRSKAFDRAALAPLGYELVMAGRQKAGLGEPPKPNFRIGQGEVNRPRAHVAFRARDRASVDAFYKAALAAAGRDSGPPALRLHDHANHDGAFVLDPDGHNSEAVGHGPG